MNPKRNAQATNGQAHASAAANAAAASNHPRLLSPWINPRGFTALLSKHPQQANIALVIGKILTSHQHMAEAVPYLEVASKHTPYERVLADLAYAYSQSGEKIKARNAFKDVIKQEQER